MEITFWDKEVFWLVSWKKSIFHFIDKILFAKESRLKNTKSYVKLDSGYKIFWFWEN